MSLLAVLHSAAAADTECAADPHTTTETRHTRGTPMGSLMKAQARAHLAVQQRASVRLSERGDVPGWVMITLMTAGLVAILWTVADTQLQALFQRAMNTVTR